MVFNVSKNNPRWNKVHNSFKKYSVSLMVKAKFDVLITLFDDI